jgi:hypothetical protein
MSEDANYYDLNPDSERQVEAFRRMLDKLPRTKFDEAAPNDGDGYWELNGEKLTDDMIKQLFCQATGDVVKNVFKPNPKGIHPSGFRTQATSTNLGRIESMTEYDLQFLRDCGIQTDEKENQ